MLETSFKYNVDTEYPQLSWTSLQTKFQGQML